MDTNRITQEEPEVGTLIKGAITDLEKLATQHVKLFKTELKQDMDKAKQGAISLVLGMNILFIGGVLLAFMLAHGLVALFPSLPYWAAYGIVGLLVGGAGGAFLFLAAQRFDEATPVADQTAQELEEDVKWLKNPK